MLFYVFKISCWSVESFLLSCPNSVHNAGIDLWAKSRLLPVSVQPNNSKLLLHFLMVEKNPKNISRYVKIVRNSHRRIHKQFSWNTACSLVYVLSMAAFRLPQHSGAIAWNNYYLGFHREVCRSLEYFFEILKKNETSFIYSLSLMHV